MFNKAAMSRFAPTSPVANTKNVIGFPGQKKKKKAIMEPPMKLKGSPLTKAFG